MANPDSFQPLSVSLTAFAKIRTKSHRKSSAEPTSSLRSTLPRTAFVFLKPGPASDLHRARRASTDHSVLPEGSAQWPSALLFDATTLELCLHALEPSQAPMASRAAQVQHLSGLSQLMQRKAVGVATTETAAQTSEASLVAVPKAFWDLAAAKSGGIRFDASSHVYPPVGASNANRRGPTNRWTSYAEIATFSRSLKILPRSIYTAHQFTFSLLSDLTLAAFTDGDYSEPRSSLRVRQEVVIAPGGSDASLLDSAPPGTSPTRSRILYGEPIRSAVETVLDAPRPFSPESPSYLPAFPNGMRGKHGNRWSSAMAITAGVKPSIAGAHGRVRNQIGRVYARGRRASSDVVPPSVSFDTDEDAVRVEPTSMTSGTSLTDVEDDEDDADWTAWNDDGSQKARLAAAAASATAGGNRHVSPVLGPTPFELDEEWDDPVTSKPLSPPAMVPSLVPEPITREVIQPGSLSTSPLLAVPSIDHAQSSSASSDSDRESKESRFVLDTGTTMSATASVAPHLNPRKPKKSRARK